MNSSSQSPRSGNPFSTRFIRPGAIPYFFPSGIEIESILARLEQNGWRGQIIGPHGTGKSSLVAALLPRLSARGRRPLSVMLRDRQNQIPADFYQLAQKNSQDQWIIDGFEQLGGWARRRLKRHCQRHGGGLLVTAHESRGLPTIWQTAVDADLARRVVGFLARQPGFAACAVSDNQLLESLKLHQGNLREVLFDLYDLYEQQRGVRRRSES